MYRIVVFLVFLYFLPKHSTCHAQVEAEVGAQVYLDDFVMNCDKIAENYTSLSNCEVAGQDGLNFGGVSINWFETSLDEGKKDPLSYKEITNLYSTGAGKGVWERYLFKDQRMWVGRGGVTAPLTLQPPIVYDELGKRKSGAVVNYRPPNPLTLSFLSGTAYMRQNDKVDRASAIILGSKFIEEKDTPEGKVGLWHYKAMAYKIQFGSGDKPMPEKVSWYLMQGLDPNTISIANLEKPFCDIESTWKLIKDKRGVAIHVPEKIINVVHFLGSGSKSGQAIEIRTRWRIEAAAEEDFTVETVDLVARGEGKLGELKTMLAEELTED